VKLFIQTCFTITFLMFLGISAKAGVADPTLFGLAACDCEGEVKDVESCLYTINTSTGAATAVGTGVGFERCSGMDFDSTGTKVSLKYVYLSN